MVLDTSALVAILRKEPERDSFATNIRVAAVDLAQAHAARDAWLRYGKGRSPAGLNFGDCFSYALATTTGRPLLFKGNDFAETDVTSAAA